MAAALLFGVAIMSSTTVQAQRGSRGGGSRGGGFHGGGFHGGGFRGGGFHGGGFRPRIIIGPRFGYGYPYGYYGYPYGAYSQYVFGDSVAADSQGYQDGLKTGSDDARRGQSYDPERSHYFKDSGFGNFAENYAASPALAASFFSKLLSSGGVLPRLLFADHHVAGFYDCIDGTACFDLQLLSRLPGDD
jgi:hypothetical protein